MVDGRHIGAMFNSFEIFIATYYFYVAYVGLIPIFLYLGWAGFNGRAFRALLTLVGIVVLGIGIDGCVRHVQGPIEDATVEQFSDIAHATVVNDGASSDLADAIGGSREDAQPIKVTLQDDSEVVYLFTFDNDSGEVTLYLPDEAYVPEPESLR